MEVITVNLPETLHDLTLVQLQRLEPVMAEQDAEVRAQAVCSIVYKMTGAQVRAAARRDIATLVAAVDKVLSEEPRLIMRFKLGEVEYGFIPDLERITTAEWVDLETLGFQTEDLHKIMAVLFRPVADARGDKYSIVPYAPEHSNAELMKSMPADVAKAAILFFSHLGLACLSATLKSESQTRTRTSHGNGSLKSGGGTPL